MRLALISDIHGNMEAFRQVLKDIERSNIDAGVCLGDNIGYGPEPDQVVNLIRKLNIPSIMGNHELAVIDRKYLMWFNPLARMSLEKTIKLLSESSIDFISTLRSSMVFQDCRFVHGFPPDSQTIYLFQVSNNYLLHVFKQMKERLCFVGHTHVLEIIGFDGQTISRQPLEKGIKNLNKEHKYIINIGSVGQPRDGNNNAKYVIWDTLKNNIEVRYRPYDIATVVNKIIAAGLPMEHAMRLW